jgi:hypothetical protein
MDSIGFGVAASAFVVDRQAGFVIRLSPSHDTIAGAARL